MSIVRTIMILVSGAGVVFGIGYIPEWKAQLLALTFFGVFLVSALLSYIDEHE